MQILKIGAEFTDAELLENADFGNAQFRGSVIFLRVTFHKGVNFYSTRNESAFSAAFENVKFKK